MISLNSQIQPLRAPVSEDRHDLGKIRSVASQFEAVLLTSLLGHLQKSFSSLPGSSGSQSGEYESLEAQALASGLAAKGGIGIARMIVHNLLNAKGQEGIREFKFPSILPMNGQEK